MTWDDIKHTHTHAYVRNGEDCHQSITHSNRPFQSKFSLANYVDLCVHWIIKLFRSTKYYHSSMWVSACVRACLNVWFRFDGWRHTTNHRSAELKAKVTNRFECYKSEWRNIHRHKFRGLWAGVGWAGACA